MSAYFVGRQGLALLLGLDTQLNEHRCTEWKVNYPGEARTGEGGPPFFLFPRRLRTREPLISTLFQDGGHSLSSHFCG